MKTLSLIAFFAVLQFLPFMYFQRVSSFNHLTPLNKPIDTAAKQLSAELNNTYRLSDDLPQSLERF